VNPVGDGVGTVELVEEVDVDETELEEVEDDDEELEGDMVPADVNFSICFSIKILVGRTSRSNPSIVVVWLSNKFILSRELKEVTHIGRGS
jgi:hypothetical protein